MSQSADDARAALRRLKRRALGRAGLLLHAHREHVVLQRLHDVCCGGAVAGVGRPTSGDERCDERGDARAWYLGPGLSILTHTASARERHTRLHSVSTTTGSLMQRLSYRAPRMVYRSINAPMLRT